MTPKSLVRFRNASFSDKESILLLDQNTRTESARIDFIHSQMESSSCYVAVIGDEIVAALGFTRSGIIGNLDENDPELVYFKLVFTNAK